MKGGDLASSFVHSSLPRWLLSRPEAYPEAPIGLPRGQNPRVLLSHQVSTYSAWLGGALSMPSLLYAFAYQTTPSNVPYIVPCPHLPQESG